MRPPYGDIILSVNLTIFDDAVTATCNQLTKHGTVVVNVRLDLRGVVMLRGEAKQPGSVKRLQSFVIGQRRAPYDYRFAHFTSRVRRRSLRPVRLKLRVFGPHGLEDDCVCTP